MVVRILRDDSAALVRVAAGEHEDDLVCRGLGDEPGLIRAVQQLLAVEDVTEQRQAVRLYEGRAAIMHRHIFARMAFLHIIKNGVGRNCSAALVEVRRRGQQVRVEHAVSRRAQRALGARTVLGRPERCKWAHGFQWEYS